MISTDSKVKKSEVKVNNETQLCLEYSTITAVVRNVLYEHGHTAQQVDNIMFGAFKFAMEDDKAFPYTSNAPGKESSYENSRYR